MAHFALTLVASVASPAMERRNDGCGSERKGSIAGEKGAAKAPRGPCVESDAYASCLQRTAAPMATRNGSELWNAGRRFLVSTAPLSAVCWHCRTFVQGARARPSVIQASTALRRNGHWTYACSAGAQARARWYLRPCLLPAADSRCNTTAMRLARRERATLSTAHGQHSAAGAEQGDAGLSPPPPLLNTLPGAHTPTPPVGGGELQCVSKTHSANGAQLRGGPVAPLVRG